VHEEKSVDEAQVFFFFLLSYFNKFTFPHAKCPLFVTRQPWSCIPVRAANINAANRDSALQVNVCENIQAAVAYSALG